MNQGFDFIKRLPDRMDPVAVAMACDDAMLSLAEKGIATIRIYYWGKPELSLGYFQPADIRLSMGYNPQPPWARRSTGGKPCFIIMNGPMRLPCLQVTPWQAKPPRFLVGSMV